MPYGYLITVVLVALCTLLALAPVGAGRRLNGLRFRLTLVLNELPLFAFYLLLVSSMLALSDGQLDSAGGLAGLILAGFTSIGLAVIGWRGSQARPALKAALDQSLGEGWFQAIDPQLAAGLRRRPSLTRIALAPYPAPRRDVERIRNVSYGDAGKRNLLDIYCHRSRPAGAPVLVHFHGGRFVSGHKSRETRPLFYRLASQGWVCVSANYRLAPEASFPDYLVDAKRVVAWIRKHGDDYGADPDTLFVSGSSAGGYLAAMVALTANEPAFQPGFEGADTSVAAAVPLFGYFGSLRTGHRLPSSPRRYVDSAAPPFFVIHGDRDTVVSTGSARGLVGDLRRSSTGPVVYAELPGAQHSFDLFHSLRFEAVIDGIEAFAAWVRSNRKPG